MKINKKFILFSLLIAAVSTAAILSLAYFARNFKVISRNLPTNVVSAVPESESARLLFVGDLMFDRGIRYYASQNGGNDFIFDKISAMLSSEDLVVANLEGPITNNKSVSAGTTPGSADNYYFTFDPGVAKTLYEKNTKLVSLGNNHILNFGRAGLVSTKDYLDQAGISYFGAPGGERSIIKTINGINIEFVNYNEFAGSNIAGEQKLAIDEIAKVRAAADIVVVFCHWGVEYSKIPENSDINLAHQFIDSGADLVVGSHPHVVQITEIYKGKRIYYSLGNFIFDQYFNEDVRNGLGVGIKIDKTTKQLDFSDKYFYLDSNGQTIDKTE